MPDLTVPLVLLGLVVLLLLGQWIVVRRAKSVRGQRVPESVATACAEGDWHFEGARLLVFESAQCVACRRMAPAIRRLQAEYPGRICVLSVTTQRSIALSLRIMATPTVVLIDDEQVIDVFVGITPYEVLAQAVQRRVGENATIA
ncbi:thioredoxin family protein [Halothiobacillus sp. DCM-1]|uniref:thioredoxin family protein n=1 Tax=Halothiobacillus sp. DCM-1 TaxID=3112558 RepID=UPI00325603D0